jgi:hypothetical protein
MKVGAALHLRYLPSAKDFVWSTVPEMRYVMIDRSGAVA